MNCKKKKGTVAANNRAQEELLLRKTYQSYLNTVRTVCLILIIIGMVLMYIGAFVDMDFITTLGIGIGGSAGVISVMLNLTED